MYEFEKGELTYRKFVNGKGRMKKRWKPWNKLSDDIKAQWAEREAAERAEVVKTQQATARTKVAKKANGANYSKMTVAQLKEVCEKKGIEGYKSMKKAELVAALEQ